LGIWLIKYGLMEQAENEYLDWFHNIHIAEKLARPGYSWAAHYRINNAESEVSEYIALFGAASSRVFYDPSPLQIKPNQDSLTREMMSHRIEPHMQILTKEWTESSNQSANTSASLPIQSPGIALWFFEHSSAADPHQSDTDQIISSWCAQEFFKSKLETKTYTAMHKLLASTGLPRHVVLQELSSDSLKNDDYNIQFSLDCWRAKNSVIALTAIQAALCWPEGK